MDNEGFGYHNALGWLVLVCLLTYWCAPWRRNKYFPSVSQVNEIELGQVGVLGRVECCEGAMTD